MTNFNMVDSPQGLDPKRLLLAVVVTTGMLMAYSYFFPPTVSTPEAAKNEQKMAEPAGEKLAQIEANPTELRPVHEHATERLAPRFFDFSVSEAKDAAVKARTSYRAEISNVGGKIDRFVLSDFRQESVIFDENKLGTSLLRISANPGLRLAEDASYEVVSETKDSLRLRHVTPDGLAVERHYQFLPQAKIKEDISFKNMNAEPLRIAPKLSASKRSEEAVEASFFNPSVSEQSIAIKTGKEYERLKYADLVDKPKSFSSIKYVGFDDQFFLAAILPKYAEQIENVNLRVVEVKKDDKEQKTAHIDISLRPFVLLHGEEKVLSHEFYIGPKQIEMLASINPPLDENIDFGWFGVLSRPMLWLLVQIFGFVKNYGIAIILITFLIKLLTYPLTAKSFSSQAEMKKLQPKIKELQDKYSHDRSMLGQKTMELYKEHGVNPLAGCLPLLIQLPIWFAFFQMLRNSVELFDQPFYGWLTDLTQPDQYFVLPLLMGITMLIQQVLTPTPADQPQLKYMMWAMPIFLTFIMLNMPSGLSLYLLTNNLLTIGQQLIIKRQSERVSA